MSFRKFTVYGKRFAAGTRTKGIFVNGEATEFTFKSGVQQPTPDDIDLLEEGKRTRKTIVLFCTTVLNLPTTDKNADIVQWENEWYEVNVFRSYRSEFPKMYKAVCTKIENIDDIPVYVEPETP